VNINSFVVPSAGEEGQTIALSAQATSDSPGASLNYQWNFGDGNTQSGINLTNPTHASAAPATAGSPYNVSLTVSDGTNSATATAPGHHHRPAAQRQRRPQPDDPRRLRGRLQRQRQ
jgi:hypothetical protein